jgi:serine/threonine protein kinase/tetratricopeptide (TPR) repeat protein
MNELELFAAAIGIADPGEREFLLDKECAGRPELRQRLDQLLAAHFQRNSLLDDVRSEHTRTVSPSGSAADPTRIATEAQGTVIAGRYKLLEEIGEGGMGTVWVAEQTEPVKRKVALKLIKAGMDSRSVLARFEAERQALALMDHPNIAKVLDGGLTEAGRPFFVMDYVKGVPITEYCDAKRLSVAERLALFVHVCQAIQHAHQKGIIHRDLKPSNILVAPYDEQAVPKIIDFGLAKAMHQSLTERTFHTAHESVLGTPLYMSPEQAQLNNLDVDTRTDIYSLGVLLYELLTGSTPLEKKRFKEAAWDEVRRIIREEEPPRPSTRLSSSALLPSVAAGRQAEPTRLTKLVRGELDWIVMKALEKDRRRRYETANGFAMDVQRFLAGESVLAVPPSTGYRLRKLAGKHRAALTTAVAIGFLLVAGIAASTWQAVRATRAEAAAREAQRAEAERALGERRANAELGARNRELADERAEVLAREGQAISAVKKFRDAVANEPELKNTPQLEGLRKRLLKEPLVFSRELRDRLQADRDTRPESLARLAEASSDLGALTNEIGNQQDALTAYRGALAIYQKLVQAHPTATEYQSRLARSRLDIAAMLKRTGKPAEAEAEYRNALAIFQKLAEDNPTVTDIRRHLGSSHYGIAQVLAETGRPAQSDAEYRTALAIFQKLAEDNPTGTDFRGHLGAIFSAHGALLGQMGKPAEAEAEVRRAMAILRELAERDGKAPKPQGKK